MSNSDQSSGQPLPTVDQTASDAAKAVDDALDAAEQAAEASAEAAAPILKAPFITQIFGAIANWITGQFKSFFGLGVGFVIIDVQEYFALKSAAKALADLQAAQKSGDQNAINQANANMDAAVAPVLHYIGSVKP